MKKLGENPFFGIPFAALCLLGYFAFISFSMSYDKNVRFSPEVSKARLAAIQQMK